MATKKEVTPPRPVTNEQMKEVSALALRWLNAAAEVVRCEELLAEAKKEFTRIEQIDLPEAIRETGLKALQLPSGEKIKLDDDISVSIPKDNKADALRWLRKNDYGGIIKCVVAAAFGSGDLERAEALVATLSKKKGINVALEETVHPQTLKAFVKEQVATGKKFPMDLFGARSYSRATVKKMD